MACHPKATYYHIVGCCYLVNSLLRLQSHMPRIRVQSSGEINVTIVPHCRVQEFHPPYWKSFSAIFYFLVFTAQCYPKRGICQHAVSVRPSVCLSVRPSVMFVSCVKTNKDIFEIFSPPGSQAILVFPYRTGWRYSDGNPPPHLTRASNAWVVWKNDNFRPIYRSISETVIARWAHSARQFVNIEFSFHPYNI